MDRKGILLCLVGPAGSGKTSLARKLLEKLGGSMDKAISATSRSPRPGENDGVHYVFLAAEDFKQRIDQGHFFEWEQVHGNYYGQLKATLEKINVGNHDLLLDIDIRGATSIKNAFPEDAVVVFLLPPSKDALKERIVARAPTSQGELDRRLQTAEAELVAFMKCVKEKTLVDYCLVNTDFDETLFCLHSIVVAERARVSRTLVSSISSIIGKE